MPSNLKPNIVQEIDPKKSEKEKRRKEKFLALLEKAGDQKYEGNASDIVIPVMGPTGVGKSTFVNSLLKGDHVKMMVGHSLTSCTTQLQPVVIGGNKKAGRIIVVDTPGFDDTYLDDSEILRRISVWLAASYNQDMKLAGIVYLHDISQTRMLGTMRRNLDMFRKLIGEDALNLAVLGTTKWELVEKQIAESRQNELKAKYWANMIKAGCQVVAVGKEQTPQEVVNDILRGQRQNKTKHILEIQDELVELQKFIPETEAGKALKYSINEFIEIQRVRVERLAAEKAELDDAEVQKEHQELTQGLQKLLQAAKAFKIPFSARIRRAIRL